MYLNDVHILLYIIIFIIGAIIGLFIEWINTRIVENKKIFSKDIIKEVKNNIQTNKIKINYYAIISTAILYVIILYKYGIKSEILQNLELVKYIILIPILISIIIIDYKKKIVPNRLTLTIFETGIIFTFLYGLNSVFIARDYLFGMIIGLIIFGIIALLGRIIAGKEAMGMGDIKLLAALGLYFGISLTISISIISFIIAGIISVIIMIMKKKKAIEYISFGPCIALAAILCIIIPQELIVSVLLTIFTLGRYKM